MGRSTYMFIYIHAYIQASGTPRTCFRTCSLAEGEMLLNFIICGFPRAGRDPERKIIVGMYQRWERALQWKQALQ